MDALVICIAEPAAPEHESVRAAARLLEQRLPAGARLVRAPALDVDQADDVAASATVVVVAVDTDAGAVAAHRVEAAPHGEWGRPLNPGHLLDIAYATHAACPRMSLVSVPPRGCGHEAGAAEEAAAEVLRLLGVG